MTAARSELILAFCGDIVGEPGRRAFTHAAATLRERHPGLVLIANAENSKHGSGLSAEGCRALRAAGADALTLGDHVFRERQAIPIMEDPEAPIARPANLAAGAPGKTMSRIPPRAGGPPVYVVTVLGRLHMTIPADDPFAAIDRELGRIPEQDAVALVEIHCEATSEKQAVAWHCARRWPGRVACVVGTHTHVQTADPRILEHRVAAITDVGMTGAHESVLGREVNDVLRAMTEQAPTVLEVASGDSRADGVVVWFDLRARRATRIEPFSLACPG